jgi:hypothetical protein
MAIRTRYNQIASVEHNGRVKWSVGSTYAVQPGRGQKQIARIRLTRITCQKLFRITNAEAQAEGFSNRQEFMRTWESIHGLCIKDTRVWILEFELIETTHELSRLSWPKQKRLVPASQTSVLS